MIAMFGPVFAMACLAGGLSELMRHVSQDPSRSLKDGNSCPKARHLKSLYFGFLYLSMGLCFSRIPAIVACLSLLVAICCYFGAQYALRQAGGPQLASLGWSQLWSRFIDDWHTCLGARLMVYMCGGLLLLGVVGVFLSVRNGLL